MRNPGHTSLGQQGRVMFFDAQKTLVAGTVAETALPVDANCSIWTQRVTAAGTLGYLSYDAIVDGDPGSFNIVSSNVLDVSTVRTFIMRGIGQANPAGGQASGGASPGFQWGTTTLVAGAKIVNTVRIPSGAKIMVCRKDSGGGALGHLYAHTVTPGDPGSFTITSSNVADDSGVYWAVVDPLALAAYHFLGKTEGSARKAVQVLSGVLVAGTVTLTGTFPAAAKTGIYAQRTSLGGGAPGHLTIGTVTAGDGGSVVVSSDNGADTSNVDVFVFDHESFGRVIV